MKRILIYLLGPTLIAGMLFGCSFDGGGAAKTTIEMVSYKIEAVAILEEFEKDFNRENPDLNLVIETPREAVTVIKTRLIKEDAPDIIGIGGENFFSILVDTGVLADISDYKKMDTVKQRYLDIDKELEIVPQDGVYGLPYVANASGILYNETIFEENGWDVPTTWDELMSLCEMMESAGIAPFTLGHKDSWTTLAPWNALAVSLTSPDLITQVNLGNDSFANHYGAIALKQQQLLQYSDNDPFAYGYIDACTAFARGQSAMLPLGSYSIPQIKSVNPDIEIGSFVMPASNDSSSNLLNSGIDLQFCVMESSTNKEACYRVLEFFQRDENIQKYVDNQIAIPCQNGDFELNEALDGMKYYIDSGLLMDYPDHRYPSELGADALIQTYLLNGDLDSFLSTFDADWLRFNRDNIAKLKDYYNDNQ